MPAAHLPPVQGAASEHTGENSHHVLLAPPVCLTPPSLILLLRIRKLKKDLLHELTESSTSGGMFCVCGTTRQVVVERSLRQ